MIEDQDRQKQSDLYLGDSLSKLLELREVILVLKPGLVLALVIALEIERASVLVVGKADQSF